MYNKLKYLRYYFAVMSRVAPKTAAAQALHLFARVPKRSIYPREQQFYKLAHRKEIVGHPAPIVYYELGDPKGHPVILIHGWSSIPGALSAPAFALADAGYRIVAVTLHGHGEAAQRSTNVVKCSMHLDRLLRHLKIQAGFYALTHSFGSIVLPYTTAKYAYRPDKIIMINNPGKLTDIFDNFAWHIGIKARAYPQMILQINRILGEDYTEISVAKKLSLTDYNQILLIHDELDKVTPFQNSLDIADQLPRVQLMRTKGAGHSAIVRKKEVIDRVLSFFGSEDKNPSI